MSKDGLELFFDMDKLKDIPVRPNLVWDKHSLEDREANMEWVIVVLVLIVILLMKSGHKSDKED